MTAPFDTQAARFDERAGLPDQVCPAIARAVLAMAGDPPSGRLLEIGAGTGQLGWHFRTLCRYVGFDVSAAMLAEFRGRGGAESGDFEILEADANRRWPVDDRSVNILFSSRTLHLLDLAHVVEQAYRVAADGGVLIVGRVRREPESVKAEMRRQMRHFLKELGVAPRGNQQNRESLFQQCCDRGARLLPPSVAATWQVEHSPVASIESWQSKDGLAGVEVSAEVKQAVLERLRQWALDRYGDLHERRAAQEAYVLEAVAL